MLASYAAARTELAAAVVESDQVGAAVVRLVEGQAVGWERSAAELLDAPPTPSPLPDSWPRTPASLSGRITRLAPALAAVGFRSTGAARTAPRRSNSKRLAAALVPRRAANPNLALAPI